MAEQWQIYVGTYTKNTASAGIYACTIDPATGVITQTGTTAGIVNPSFLALHPSGNHLYAVTEIEEEVDGRPGGGVSAYERNHETGALTLLNSRRSHGLGPCYVAVDPKGQLVLVANYGSGSVAALPITANGRLEAAAFVDQHHGASVNEHRQQGPHAHSIMVDPSGHYVFSADLGMDFLFIYRLDDGRLTRREPVGVALHPGAGPRHFAFHPSKPFFYVINELDSTITTLSWDAASGVAEPLQTVSTLPDDFTGETTCADIHLDPAGKFVYGSNRGHDSIAIFAIDQQTGLLDSRGHTPSGGKTPRNFALSPDGRFVFVANQNSNNIVTFQRDEQTGALTPTGASLELPAPVCIVFAP